jgi:hypothetical protein
MYQEIIINNNSNNKLITSVESSSKNDMNNEDEGVSGVVDDGDADAADGRGGVTTRITNKNNYLKVSHNSVLNCLFLLTKENKLIVYDCNSFVILKEVDWNLKTCE